MSRHEKMDPGRLIDTQAIAELLGVSRQHVTGRITKRPDFPRPVMDLSRRLRRWRLDDVIEWAGLSR